MAGFVGDALGVGIEVEELVDDYVAYAEQLMIF